MRTKDKPRQVIFQPERETRFAAAEKTLGAGIACARKDVKQVALQASEPHRKCQNRG